ncbi:c-type cytochrome [Thiosocius teredinicola]|uniref:c-type cytochrome n=1 Tax=Thiosocius teredinicola TaxID=1973002 RepID=UPI0009913497
MTTNFLKAMCLGFVAAGVCQTAWSEDATINRLLASQCAQCHGSNGRAVGDMDSLAGESADEIYEELMEMRSEDTPEDIMEHQAMGYTEDQIRRIAAYYGSIGGGSSGSGSGGSGSGDHESDEDEHERSRDSGKEYERERRKRRDRDDD